MSKQEAEITVRVRRGTKVIEDMLLSTAKKNVHRGWKIEHPNYTEDGRLITTSIGKMVEEKAEQEIVVNERKKIEIKFDQSGMLEKIEKMRSIEKLESIIEKNYSEEVTFAAQLRIEELNK